MPQPSIHWHEGLFLRPHHFQYFQRQVEDLVASERLPGLGLSLRSRGSQAFERRLGKFSPPL